MSFDITIDHAQRSRLGDPCPIKIVAGGHVFTRLLRGATYSSTDSLLARPEQLAFWFVDNWWRLRWEGMPPDGVSPEWRLAHDVSEIGGGTSWPRLLIWGEGQRIGMSSKSDPVGVVGPVRFLENGMTFIPASEWECTVDHFLDEVKDDRFGSDLVPLRAQVDALLEERSDPEMAAWRRLEARLGFDVDQAPDALMESVLSFTSEFDERDIEEAIQASPGHSSAEVLSRELEAARASRLICNFKTARDASGRIDWDGRRPVWEPAERAADEVRRAAGRAEGPLRNKELAELLGMSPAALRTVKDSPRAGHLPYGLRVAAPTRGDGVQVLALKARGSADRRFEVARALGDTIWERNGRLGPLARTKTDRQRFQRAFAQSLLCPFSELKEFVDEHGTDDEGIHAAACHYHVNQKVIERTLVKKGVLPAQQFDDLVEAA